MTKLPLSWFEGTDVVQMARALLGKIIVTEFDGIRTSGRISETEAYAGESDRASHCYGGRRTARTEIMYGSGGFAYVYLCYGIHHLFNVVTNKAEMPQVVLIRAIEPVEGIAAIRERLGKLLLCRYISWQSDPDLLPKHLESELLTPVCH